MSRSNLLDIWPFFSQPYWLCRPYWVCGDGLVCVRLLCVVCTECIVAKCCDLEQKLLLTETVTHWSRSM